MKIRIEAGKAKGTMKAPPSKSMAHRLLICSGLCGGESIIHGIDKSEDVLATVSCLKAIGAECSFNGNSVKVKGINALNIQEPDVLNCRESGSTQRFFIPLCLLSDERTVVSGADGLFRRPLNVYEEICRSQGILFEQNGNRLILKGKLKSGVYRVKGNISSQFISGLMFALPLLKGDSQINIIPPLESRSYIDLTMSALERFGVKAVWQDDKTIFIKGSQSYTACETEVEGDYSNAAFFGALNALGSDIEMSGLNPDSIQGDKVYKKCLEKLLAGTPTVYLGDCPDLAPVLMAVAAAKNGAVFNETRRLKIKESDRGSAMAEELRKFGTAVTVYENSIVVYPSEFHKPEETLCGHNDHRIVMALSVLLTLTGGEIDGAEAVSKSLPDFFERLKNLGIGVNEI